MSRIPYADPQALSDAVRQALGPAPINLQRMRAGASEPVFLALSQMMAAFYDKGALPAQIREIAVLTVGARSPCAYEVTQHLSAARLVGLSEAQIEAIRQGGRQGVLDERQQAVVDFTEEVIVRVGAGDAALARLRRHFSDREVLDLTILIGIYMMLARVIETAGVEIDSEAPDWEMSAPQALR
jgi:alkylhydroperoxidase family enzyme